MHPKPVLFLLFSLLAFEAFAQRNSLGFSAGATGFLGDLGGYQSTAQPLYLDLNFQAVRPEIGFQYDHEFIRHYQKVFPNQYSHFSFTAQLQLLQVAGADSLIHPAQPYTGGWFRWYRNLSFRSNIAEATARINYMLFTRNDFSTRRFFTPYIFTGFGIFYMNPQTSYAGEWISLHPLHTEGEGFADSLKTYSLVQPVIPVGVGLKFQVGENILFFAEFCHRFTFTDYIDDVSKKYISEQDFEKYFANDPQKAQLAFALSNRSTEKNLPEDAYITAPGQQRGDSKNNDQYFSVRVGLSFRLYHPLNFHTFRGYVD